MSKRVSLRVAVLLIVASAAVGGASAQGRGTSGLTGTIRAQDGSVVVGASVTIESPEMLGGRKSTITEKNGTYRFAELPPGTYAITVVVPGYKTVKHDGVRLPVGLSIDVPFKLELYAGEETVLVTGEAPEIDVRSPQTSVNLPDEILQNLPASRFQPDTLNLAPGINLDSAWGGGGSSSIAWQIDGVDTSDPEAGSAWSFVNYNIVDQVQLVGLGAPAEYGGFTGVVFNSTTKSGGNKLDGKVEGFFSNDSMTSSNNAPPGINPTVNKFIDATAQVGGPFIKDKLWYFVSAQYFNQVTNNGGPDRTEKSPRVFAKINWQIDPNNELTTWAEWDRYDIKGRGGDNITPLEATVRENAPEWVWNVTWKSVLSPQTILETKFGGYTGYYYLDPEEGYDIAGRFDAITGNYYQNSTYYFLADRDRNQLNSSLTHHANDFIKGDHDFKFGMEIERSTVRNRYGYPTGAKFYDNYYGYNPNTGNYETYTAAYYGGSYDVHAKNRRISLFAQDAWQITPNFTLNPGVRIDVNRGRVPQRGTVFKTEPVAPRLGFAWNVTGDGKNLIKLHYGKYYEGLKASYYYWVAPGAYEDLTIRNIWEDGFVEDVAVIAKRYAIQDNLKHPSMDQWVLGFDRELWPGFTFSATAIYRKNENFIETVALDGDFTPVTGQVGVLDADGNVVSTGQTVTLYDWNNSDSSTLTVTNPKGVVRKYKGLMLTGTRRLQKNWQLMASYVYSKTEGNIDNVDFDLSTDSGGQNGGPSPFLDTPNSLVNGYGHLTHDQKHQIKIQGTYQIPAANLWLSGNWTFHSGDTYTKKTDCLLSNDDGDPLTNDCHDFPQGRVRYFAETRGSRRLASRNEIDLRAEWRPQLGRGLNLGVMLDVFNALNQGRSTEVQDRDEGDFGAVREYSLPRNLRLGARLTF